MDKETQGAVKELLSKIPEKDLEAAGGALTDRQKNLLFGAGGLLVGAGIGAGGMYAYNKWGKKSDTGTTPASTTTDPGTAAQKAKDKAEEQANATQQQPVKETPAQPVQDKDKETKDEKPAEGGDTQKKVQQ